MTETDDLLEEFDDKDLELMLSLIEEAEDVSTTWPALPVHVEQLELEGAYSDYRADQIHLVFRLTGALDVAGLVRAHARLAERHSALRSRFVQGASGWELCDVGAIFSLCVRRVDQVDEELVLSLLHEERSRRISLREGPLSRALLATDTIGEHLLVWSLSHAIVDGWSLGILWDDLTAIYGGQELADVPGFGEYLTENARVRAAWGNSEQTEVKRMLGLETTSRGAPLAKRRAAPQIVSTEILLETDILNAVQRTAVRHGATTYMVVLGAFRRALADTNAVDKETVIWSPVAGRTSARWERTVGMFVRPLPVDLHTPQGTDAAALVQATRDSVLRILDAQHIDRSVLRDVPAATALFVMQNTGGGDTTLPGCTVRVARPEEEPQMAPVLEFYSTPSELFLIGANVGYRKGTLAILLESDADRLDGDRLKAVAERWEQILRSLEEPE